MVVAAVDVAAELGLGAFEGEDVDFRADVKALPVGGLGLRIGIAECTP